MQCTLIPEVPNYLVSWAVIAIGLGALVYKKHREGPERQWSEFGLDTSKQLLGLVYYGLLSYFMGPGQSAAASSSSSLADTCSELWVATNLDTAIGTPLDYVFLNTATFVLERATGDTGDFLTGEYTDDIGRLIPRKYFKQLAVWLGCITVMKLVMVDLVSHCHSFCLAVAQVALSFGRLSEAAERVFVLVVTPLVMMCLQLWLTDDFLQKGGVPFATASLRLRELCDALKEGCRRKLLWLLDRPGRRSGKAGDLRSPFIDVLAAGGRQLDEQRRQRDKERSERLEKMLAAERRDRQMDRKAAERAERRLAEEQRDMEEARDSVEKNLRQLHAAQKKHAEIAAEDSVDRQRLRARLADLEGQLVGPAGSSRTMPNTPSPTQQQQTPVATLLIPPSPRQQPPVATLIPQPSTPTVFTNSPRGGYGSGSSIGLGSRETSPPQVAFPASPGAVSNGVRSMVSSVPPPSIPPSMGGPPSVVLNLTPRQASSMVAINGFSASMLAASEAEEISQLTPSDLAKFTPSQTQVIAAQRGAVLERKLGSLEAKIEKLREMNKSGSQASSPMVSLSGAPSV
eukprot:TRINITY_DN38538_c0_g1_i1.p1 TRINITY_DN38538_c0_g1~~TRINITY_DN38538_c0_g1_i1.p1  ORF type:complete len:571 (+),score=123.33 TRINITY_DN38538_c0_g1_i1:55-1767(+)